VKKLLAAAALVFAAAGSAVQTQDGGAPPAFEAASVKPSSADSRFAIRLDPDKYTASRVPLRSPIRDAYSLMEFQIAHAPAAAQADAADAAGGTISVAGALGEPGDAGVRVAGG
jgi:hypothetical protein